MVYQLVVAVYGSATIVCERNDTITNKVKCLLSQLPSGYRLPQPSEGGHYVDIQVKHIRIGRVAYRGGKTYSVVQKRAEANTFISQALQKELGIELRNLFKDLFANYVLAFTRGRGFALGAQKDAIVDFCELYRIDAGQLDFDTLKKAWQRSPQYRQFVAQRSARLVANPSPKK